MFVLFAAWMSVTPEPARVAAGRWGGTGISVDVSASGARIELDCAHGTIDAPLVLDADGNFDLPGSIARERPGPVREGEPDRSQPVRYEGRVEGDTLTLWVIRPNAPRPEKPLSAVRGKSPILRKCG
jgi:hypothetical protein